VVEKLRAAWVRQARRGSLGYSRDRLFDSAPPGVLSRDKTVRRSAQDDDFVGVSTKNILNKLALMGRSPPLLSRNRNSFLQIIFGPRTLRRTWGTRPSLSRLRCE
jgi:hypothetical protein